MIADRVIALSLAFALAFFPAIASAQSPQVRAAVLGPWLPTPAAGGTPQTPQFVGSVLIGSGTTLTSTAQNIGNPAFIATRRVIVLLSGLAGPRTLNSLTIGGVTATIHTQTVSAAGNFVAGASLLVTSGTSANIVATFSGATSGGIFFGVYNVDDSKLVSTTPTFGTNTTGSGTSVSATFPQITGGFVLSHFYCDAGATTGVITGYTNDHTFGSVKESLNHFNPVASTGTGTATATWTGSQDVAIGAYQWQ